MRMKTISKAVMLLGAFGAASLTMAADNSTDASQTAKVDRIEITGSNIKRTKAERASPVQVITGDESIRLGANTVADIVTNIASASSGGVNDANPILNAGFSSAVSSVSLRGMGSSAVLVLINGRRIAPAPFADPNSGQQNLFDLGAIPAAAVDRTEILMDGASAIYGSDAVAGVINVRLKKEFKGTTLNAGAGANEKGDFRNSKLGVTFGVGSLADDRYNVFGSFQHSDRKITPTSAIADQIYPEAAAYYGWMNPIFPATFSTSVPSAFAPLYYSKKAATATTYANFIGMDPRCPANMVSKSNATSTGSTYNKNVCYFDTWARSYQQTPATSDALNLRGTFDLGNDLRASADIIYTRKDIETPGNGSTVAGEAGNSWVRGDGSLMRYFLVLPTTHADNPTAGKPGATPVSLQYRFADIDRRDRTVLEALRVGGQLEGSNLGWDWTLGLTHNETRRKTNMKGLINTAALDAAVANGSYRFGSPTNSDAVKSAISPDNNDGGKAVVDQIDLRGSRELFDLKGGPAAIASGVEARRDSLNVYNDDKIMKGQTLSRGASSADGTRNVYSAFGEVVLPVLNELELTGAARFDHYSDYGNSRTPKLGFKFMPNDTIAFRGTYGESFRAPSLSQISKSAVTSFTATNDATRCNFLTQPGVAEKNGIARDPKTGTPVTPICSSSPSTASIISPNLGIQPETAKSKTLGFVISPSKNFSLSLDWFKIHKRDEIDRISGTTAVENEAKNPAGVIRDNSDALLLKDANGLPVAGTGPILYTLRRFENLGETILTGFDLDTTVTTKLGQYGKVVTRLTAQYLSSFQQSAKAGEPLIEYAGTYSNPYTVGESGGLPHTKAQLKNSWNQGDWDAFVNLNYTGGYNLKASADRGCSSTFSTTAMVSFSPSCDVRSNVTFDAGVGYFGIKNTTIRLNVYNLTNRKAPLDLSWADSGTGGIPASLYSVQGRSFSLSAIYSLK
ncbi:TonB-dependent receptor [Burkholderiaceae bacterium DAT-1]|nr:TonB-dependent receptor [Burkholderiaceae bacterium DAT-1]